MNGNFVEFASQGEQCSAVHWDYVTSNKNARIISLQHMKKVTTNKDFDKFSG